MAQEPVKAFISYSRKDKTYKDELLKHLSFLQREGSISMWDDELMLLGTEWDKEIKRKIKEAEIVIFLVSPDFISSDYIFDVEIKNALEDKKIVVPLIVRPCDWLGFPISRYQAFPNNGKAISQFEDRDSVYLEIVKALRQTLTVVVNNKRKEKQLDKEKIERSLYQLANLMKEAVKLMNRLPMINEKRENGAVASFLDKEKYSKDILDLTFYYITARNLILDQLKEANFQNRDDIDNLFETIFSYITMSRVGHDIDEKVWRQVYEIEISNLFSNLITQIFNYNEKTAQLD